jgi:hypothetical protein
MRQVYREITAKSELAQAGNKQEMQTIMSPAYACLFSAVPTRISRVLLDPLSLGGEQAERQPIEGRGWYHFT